MSLSLKVSAAVYVPTVCTLALPSVKMSTLSIASPGSSAQSPLTLARLFEPMHCPLPQPSVRVQALASSQGVPAGCSLVTQPRLVLHEAQRLHQGASGFAKAPSGTKTADNEDYVDRQPQGRAA